MTTFCQEVPKIETGFDCAEITDTSALSDRRVPGERRFLSWTRWPQ
jgi:hypothetical protein